MEDTKLATDFWVIGINYRKADTALRGKFAISNHQYERVLQAAPSFGISELFVLSTCNRTEVYGLAQNVHSLICLLCSQTDGDIKAFMAHAYMKSGNDALSHIFNVAAGLDSQILGDYEIVGQMKQAFSFAKERGHAGLFLNRLFNTVLQSSRAIRSETQLSSGTVSVAFAAARFITDNKKAVAGNKVLVIGSGEIGQTTCRNLVHLSPELEITLVNRSMEKAQAFANILNLRTAAFDQLPQLLRSHPIIIVATAAVQPLLTLADFLPAEQKILLDLSIPNNIDADIRQLEGITLVNVDELSGVNDETLRKRQAEVPKAKALITFFIHEFAEWYVMQQHVPVLKEVKEKLNRLNIQLAEARKQKDKEAVQKALNIMARKMKAEEQRAGCNYIETIHQYLTEIAL